MIEKQFRYYDLTKKWHKVKRHLGDKRLNDILVRDFNKYTFGRWGDKFTSGQYPTDFESCDWQLPHRGRRPSYWKYTKHAACHWLVNFTLRLAMLVEPDQEWRIITSQRHSTVWNGDDLLFDFNFQALGIEPNECFQLANVKELKPGKYLRVYFAAHYTEDKYYDPDLSEYQWKAKRWANERGETRKAIDSILSQSYSKTFDAWNRSKKRSCQAFQPVLLLDDIVHHQLLGTVEAALKGVIEQGVRAYSKNRRLPSRSVA